MARASELNAYKTGYGEFAWQMREAAHRILFTVAQSNAMNGFDSDTIVKLVTPWWQTALIALNTAFGILAGAGVAGYIAVWCIGFFGGRRKPKADEAADAEAEADNRGRRNENI